MNKAAPGTQQLALELYPLETQHLIPLTDQSRQKMHQVIEERRFYYSTAGSKGKKIHRTTKANQTQN